MPPAIRRSAPDKSISPGSAGFSETCCRVASSRRRRTWRGSCGGTSTPTRSVRDPSAGSMPTPRSASPMGNFLRGQSTSGPDRRTHRRAGSVRAFPRDLDHCTLHGSAAPPTSPARRSYGRKRLAALAGDPSPGRRTDRSRSSPATTDPGPGQHDEAPPPESGFRPRPARFRPDGVGRDDQRRVVIAGDARGLAPAGAPDAKRESRRRDAIAGSTVGRLRHPERGDVGRSRASGPSKPRLGVDAAGVASP